MCDLPLCVVKQGKRAFVRGARVTVKCASPGRDQLEASLDLLPQQPAPPRMGLGLDGSTSLGSCDDSSTSKNAYRRPVKYWLPHQGSSWILLPCAWSPAGLKQGKPHVRTCPQDMIGGMLIMYDLFAVPLQAFKRPGCMGRPHEPVVA